MLGLTPTAYLVVKSFHVVAVMAWMAGLWYLPRLFVYHADAGAGPQAEIFKTMERRLLRAIMNPAMIATFVLGSLLIVERPEIWKMGWLHAKLALVLGLAGFHGLLARWRKDFAAGRNARTGRFYRAVNEVPTALVVAIVLLAFVKPS